MRSTFSNRTGIKIFFICWSYTPLCTPVCLQLIITVLTKRTPWEGKGLTSLFLLFSMQKILLFKGQDPLQLTIFHQSLLSHESAVAWSQQEPFQQLQTAAGSVAAWVFLLNSREQEAFWCLCCLKPDKASWLLQRTSLSALNTLFLESCTGHPLFRVY